MAQKKLHTKWTIKIKVNNYKYYKTTNKTKWINKTKQKSTNEAKQKLKKTWSHAHVQKKFKNENEKQIRQNYLLITITSILFAHRSWTSLVKTFPLSFNHDYECHPTIFWVWENQIYKNKKWKYIFAILKWQIIIEILKMKVQINYYILIIQTNKT
jgi:hypothetical protein